MRHGLFSEIAWMAVDTVRTQKMRSGLTILGVVIGITSIVGMTSLVRGFDTSLRDSIRQIGPDTIFVAQFSGVSLMSGADFNDLLRRPSLTPADARAIERQAPSVGMVSLVLGEGGPSLTRERLHYRGNRTKQLGIVGSTHNYADVFHIDLELGRFFTQGEVSHRRQVVVLGQSAYLALFPYVDPIGKTVRLGNHPYTVIGVLGPRPEPRRAERRPGRHRAHPAYCVPETVRHPRRAVEARAVPERDDRRCPARGACRATRRCAR